MSIKAVFLVATSILLVSPTLVTAVAPYDLPGFVAVDACFEMGPGSTGCAGMTRADLISNPSGVFSLSSPVNGATLTGALSDAQGVVGQGHDYFVLSFNRGADGLILDGAELIFDNTQPVRFEYANAITAYAGPISPAGFGPSDFPTLLGPLDGQGISLSNGSIVFGFASTMASTPIPEPSSILLLLGGLSLAAARQFNK